MPLSSDYLTLIFGSIMLTNTGQVVVCSTILMDRLIFWMTWMITTPLGLTKRSGIG